MGSPLKRFLTVARAGVLAFLILAFGQGVWGALLASNFKTGARIPWGPLAMALVLWLMWQYLGGKWWPHSTAEARRPPKRIAEIGTPVGDCHSGAIVGQFEAGAVKRAFG